MNVVMTGAGRFVEVQGTAEGMAFTRGELDTLLGLAEAGIKELTGHAGGRAGRAAAAEVSGRGPGAPAPGAGVGQPRQGQGDRRRPVGRHAGGAGAAPERRARRGGGRRHAGRQRPPEGAGPGGGHRAWRRWPTTPAWRWTRLGGAPGRLLGPLRRRGRHLRRQRGQAAARAGGARDAGGRAAGHASRRWHWRPSPTARRSGPRACCPGRIAAGAAGRQRLRLRPRVRARRRGRPDLRRDGVPPRRTLSHRGRAFRALAARLAERESSAMFTGR